MHTHCRHGSPPSCEQQLAESVITNDNCSSILVPVWANAPASPCRWHTVPTNPNALHRCSGTTTPSSPFLQPPAHMLCRYRMWKSGAVYPNPLGTDEFLIEKLPVILTEGEEGPKNVLIDVLIPKAMQAFHQAEESPSFLADK